MLSQSKKQCGYRTGRRWLARAGLALSLGLALFFRSVPGQLRSADPVDAQVAGLLAEHCLGCHSGKEPEAGLDLGHFRTVGSIRFEAETWNKVMRRVATGSMPPPDSASVSEEERAIITAWIDRVFHEIDCSDASNPGQMTIRRLNRNEYRNSVLDLLLVDFEPAATFPGDDVGYGFDNIGDVLSLPPVLMERYLDAAESISRSVIVAPEDIAPVETPLELTRWSIEGKANELADGLFFATSGEAAFDWESGAPFRGELRIRVVGQQAGPEPCRMTVHANKKKLGTWKITEHEAAETVTVPVQFGKGRTRLRISFDNDFYDPANPDPDRRDRNLIVKAVGLLREGPEAAEPSAAEANFLFERPAKRGDEEAVARRLIAVWASRMYRRPASSGEAERLYAIHQAARADGSSWEQAMQYVLQALLVSPRFLYKVERPPPADGSPRNLTSFELATSLSYFLWNSAPDQALLQTALQKDLQDDAVLAAEVRRMVADPRHDRMIESFASQWLQMRALERSMPDPDVFPGAGPELLADMRQETILFCRDVFRSNRNLVDLLAADYSFVNGRLAAHYGVAGIDPADADFRRVELRSLGRGGLLTQASVLTVTSNPNRTSPVKRGRWILENILNEPPPPPPPNVQQLEEQKLTGTLRQRMEQHRANPACANCHAQMDPLGFAFENFDGVGRWRERDGDEPVDAAGELPDGEVFHGATELLQILLERKQREFLGCLAEKMMVYALGRGLQYQDRCALTTIMERVSSGGNRYEDLLLAIALSDPFRRRQLRTED